jgi:hypothetical protein
MRARLAPFLMLLEARYAPLLFAVSPQSYAVYLWLFPLPYSLTGEVFAVLGALGFEFVYVGAIAWAEEGRAGVWTWITAILALLFSVAVAYYVYRSQGWWALLHAGFPLVAFGYTMQLHGMQFASGAPANESTAPSTAPVADTPALLDESAPLAPPLSKSAQVRALALAHGKAESTIWRNVRKGTITLEGE